MNIKKFSNWKIQTKLIVTTLLIVLLPMMLVSYLALSRFAASLEKGAKQSLEQIVLDLHAMCGILVETSDERMKNDLKIARRVIEELGEIQTEELEIAEDINQTPAIKIIAGTTPLTFNHPLAEKVNQLTGDPFAIYQFSSDGRLCPVAKSHFKENDEHTNDCFSANSPVATASAANKSYTIRKADAEKYSTYAFEPFADNSGKILGALATGPKVESLAPLRKAVGEVKVGRTGYPYTMRLDGTLKIHPAKSGQNIIDSKASSGHFYIKTMCEKAPTLKSGEIATISYPWINRELGESIPRTKITKYAYFPQWGWIIAAGSYESEIFAQANETKRNILLIFGFTILFVIGLTMGVARRLSRPLRRMSIAAKRMADGDLSVRVFLDQEDEMGKMGAAFNNMAHQIEQYTENLQVLVTEKTKELRRTKEYFESIVESSADMIITTDKSGKITFVNRATSLALGYPLNKTIGRHVSMFYPKGFKKAREIMNMLKDSGSFSNYEMPLIALDGTAIPILTSAALLKDEEGKVIGTVGIFTDITKRKKLEAKLRKTQASLVQAGKMRAIGDLVSGVAHELNNPLMASQAIVHVIKSTLKSGDPNFKRVGIIAKCNERAEKIIKHLRELSRADEPQMELIDINRPIENTLMITGQQLLNHNITLEKQLALGLPKIMGNVNRLEQVFLNIIANARDAMEHTNRPKVLTITSSVERRAKTTMLVIKITDTGSGIPDELMEKIFNPFFSTKETNKGTGLGLAITYGIIDDHKGSIDVKTRVGAGSTFTISIPANEEKQKRENVSKAVLF